MIITLVNSNSAHTLQPELHIILFLEASQPPHYQFCPIAIHTPAQPSEYLPGSSILQYSLVFSPLPELSIEEAVGESLAADADALQNSVAPQLVQHQVSV